MEWLNLHASDLDSPEFVGSDTRERGIWLSLQRYCIGQENGGVIEDCAKWKDRQWQQLVRVTLREVRVDSRLWNWDGKNLTVLFYPEDAEAVVQMKREVARENGKLGGRPRKNQKRNQFRTQDEPTLVISEKAKGKEREGKEIIPPQPPFGGESEGGGISLVEKIKSLRRRWGTGPVLDARDSRVFGKNWEGWERYGAEDWDVVAEFMRAELPVGTAYTQPRNLNLALGMPAGLLGQARDWKVKQRPRFAVVPSLTVSDEPPATPEEMAEIFKPQRVNS